MKTLKEIIKNNDTPIEFQLFDSTFTVSANRHIYTELRKKYVLIAKNEYEKYLDLEIGYKKLDDLIENADSSFEQSLKNIIRVVVNDAVSVNILSLNADTIYSEYYKAGYADQFKNAYKAFYDPYSKIMAILQANKEFRRDVDDAGARFNRSVDSGDVFNLDGRFESALMNASDKSNAKKEFKALFQNDKMRNSLRNGYFNSLINFYHYIVNFFPKKGDIKFSDWTTNASCQKANAALDNMLNTDLSEEQKKETILLILKNNPYLDGAYPVFASTFPSLTKQFVIMANFFGAPSIISKVNNDLIAYVNENIGETEADVDYCKSLLLQKLSEVGLSKESAAPVYAVIQERSDQLDLEYRTVEGAVFETRDEADAARTSFAEHEDMLKKDCAEFILRSDYTDHIEAIRTLPIAQSISVLYAMKYEQRLSEFDKKCKAAALYEEANSSEKRSLKNRLASIGQSSDTQKSAWEEVTHNGQYSLSDIMSGMPDEKGIMNTVGDIGNTAVDKAKAAVGKLKGLFGKK